MDNWHNTTLGEVLSFQRGFDITKSQQKDGPYFVISSSGPQSTHDEYKVDGPGIVIGRKGTLGSVFYSEIPFWPHDTTLWVKDFHGNDPKFAYYFLKTLHLEQYDAGASNPSLNRNHIHLLRVKYPPLPVQRKIAEVLSAYDDLIEVNTRRIHILEQMAQSVYREWFGAETLRATSVRSSLPEGWEIKKLGDVVELAYGKGLKADQRIGGPYPVYGSAGIVGYHNKFLVRSPGIIVGRKGNVGTVFWSNKDFYPIDTTYFVRTEISLYYVFFNLQTQNFINNDAAVPGLSRSQAYSLSFLVPSKIALGKFDEFIAPIFQQLETLTAKNANLRRTRDLLLPRLVSGEVGVS